MPLTRRHLLWAAGIIPAGLAVSAIATTTGDALRGAAEALRPRASGTSAIRCALCGQPGHNMLDPRCPAARKVV